jgi:hypothetical protein
VTPSSPSKKSEEKYIQLSVSSGRLLTYVLALVASFVGGPPMVERLAPGPDVAAIELLGTKVDLLTQEVAKQGEMIRKNQELGIKNERRSRANEERGEENRALLISFIVKTQKEHPEASRELERLLRELR